MTTKNTNEEVIFKSRKDFRAFVAEDGNEMLEEIMGSKIQILSVSESSLGEQPDILAVANIHEKTIIECDLKQNIKTLANLLMHTAAYKAKHIIWCINQETPEAMETANMLSKFNQHEVKLYVVKCHIENNEVKLKALIKPDPNNYQKPAGKITDTKQKQNEFWQAFSGYINDKNLPIKITPAPQHWQYITIGISGVSIQLTVNTSKNNLGCELLIANNKELFKKLEVDKARIEKQLKNINLDWQALEGKKSSRIRTTLDFDITDKENLEQGFIWLIDTANRFKEVFTEYLKGEANG
ncbi:MAG TPA: DUF4268 domain-containing protein [Candidatus Gastranaerophilales bacterium]|nr:DUF4268 domain-containing protein [Candidatus Gastranaerophilales bacterium]